MNARTLILGTGTLLGLAGCCSSKDGTHQAPNPAYSPTSSNQPAASAHVALNATAAVFRENTATAWRADSSAVGISQGFHATVVLVNSNATVKLAQGPQEISALAFSPDGQTMAAVGAKGAVWLYETATGKIAAQLEFPDSSPDSIISGYAASFSSDGQWLAVATDKVRWWFVPSRQHKCSVESDFVLEPQFTNDGKILAATGGGNYKKWETDSCKLLEDQMAETGGTFGSVLSPDGSWLAASEDSGHGLTVFATSPFKRKGKNYARASSCEDHVNPVRFSRNGQLLLVTGAAHWFKAFRVGTFSQIGTWTALPRHIPQELYPFDDGTHVIAEWEDGSVKLIDTKNAKQEMPIEIRGPLRFSLSPDSRWFVGLTENKAIVFETSSGKQVHSLDPR